ncbi:Filamentation induced protein by cAMP/death on curing [Fusarium flagelliforme]|uniref:Filamentation induced protein by cAMP/death on curing n=1 Tax=Fusarium flagelliforme TaxID=2675880 RepID=UPI001E8DC0B8|nr:Filamentation induced protein by cAMP/death on curing [Fusarium flagelliforme]KAH7188203.1 Filamentation induced protein by cAMP/death on curing [Fusarium flagelliforme]
MDSDYHITRWPPVRTPIRSDDSYRTYKSDQNPEVLFEKTTRYLSSVTMNHAPTIEQKTTLIQWVNDTAIHALYGSNMIERAGLDWEATLNHCHSVLQHLDIEETGDIRGHREVVQHMRAYQHILHHFAILGEDMTEDLIKNTHAILCKGVPIIEVPEVPSEKYAGIYRTCCVGAGNTMFVTPQYVPTKMTEMCANLKRELEEGHQHLDPVSLASKYSLRFVEIHPFQDGNGRMCRMILNAILLRYVGIVVPIGETGEDRVEYLNIKKRASRDMEGHGEYATFVLKKGARSVQKLKQKIHGKRS